MGSVPFTRRSNGDLPSYNGNYPELNSNLLKRKYSEGVVDNWAFHANVPPPVNKRSNFNSNSNSEEEELVQSTTSSPGDNFGAGHHGHQRQTESGTLIWPSWQLYVYNQGDSIPPFEDDRIPKFQCDDNLNSKVSLALEYCDNETLSSLLDAVAIESYDAPSAIAIKPHWMNSKTKYIVQVRPPDPNHDFQHLHRCYWNLLTQTLSKDDIRTIAIPCIGTMETNTLRPFYSRPDAAKIALRVIREFLEGHSDKVDRIVLHITHEKSKSIYLRFMQVFFPVMSIKEIKNEDLYDL